MQYKTKTTMMQSETTVWYTLATTMQMQDDYDADDDDGRRPLEPKTRGHMATEWQAMGGNGYKYWQCMKKIFRLLERRQELCICDSDRLHWSNEVAPCQFHQHFSVV